MDLPFERERSLNLDLLSLFFELMVVLMLLLIVSLRSVHRVTLAFGLVKMLFLPYVEFESIFLYLEDSFFVGILRFQTSES